MTQFPQPGSQACLPVMSRTQIKSKIQACESQFFPSLIINLYSMVNKISIICCQHNNSLGLNSPSSKTNSHNTIINYWTISRRCNKHKEVPRKDNTLKNTAPKKQTNKKSKSLMQTFPYRLSPIPKNFSPSTIKICSMNPPSISSALPAVEHFAWPAHHPSVSVVAPAAAFTTSPHPKVAISSLSRISLSFWQILQIAESRH